MLYSLVIILECDVHVKDAEFDTDSQFELLQPFTVSDIIKAVQTPSKAGKANYHRPALNTASQGGALISTTHRPFTVTTGLPRFARGIVIYCFELFQSTFQNTGECL